MPDIAAIARKQSAKVAPLKHLEEKSMGTFKAKWGCKTADDYLAEYEQRFPPEEDVAYHTGTTKDTVMRERKREERRAKRGKSKKKLDVHEVPESVLALAKTIDGHKHLGKEFSRTQRRQKHKEWKQGNKERVRAATAGESFKQRWTRILSCLPTPGYIPSIKKQEYFLHKVSMGDQNYAAKALLYGQPVDFADPDGRTALWFAAFNGYNGMTKLMMRARANPNLKDTVLGRAPIHVAADKGFDDIIEVLMDPEEATEPDEDEDKPGLPAGVGALVDDRDNGGRTPLMLACQKGHLEAAQFLLDNNCRTRLADKKGWTALHFAAWRGYANIVQLLVDAGANPYSEDKHKQLPLDYALDRKAKDAIAILLEDMKPRHLKKVKGEGLFRHMQDPNIERNYNLMKKKVGEVMGN